MAELDTSAASILAEGTQDEEAGGAVKRSDSDRREEEDGRRAPGKRRDAEERREIEFDWAEAVPGFEDRREEDRRNPFRPIPEQRMAGIGEVVADRREKSRRAKKQRRD